MSGTYRRIVGAAVVVDWSQFEGPAALRCTLGVAIPLLLGLAIHQPVIGAFGAIGAVSVGFGSFQGAYRSRAAVMLFAAAGMALSVFVGSLAGHLDGAAIAIAAAWGFGGGLMVALGPSATFVGLQSIVAVLIAGGFPTDLESAGGRAALVFGGGLIQTLLVVMIWPLRRFRAERESLAAAFRSLAAYAAAIPQGIDAAPEPHTFAATASPLVDPQPFARSADVLVFQALLDEAERIRASLAGLATHQRRLERDDHQALVTVTATLGDGLAAIADALHDGREPRDAGGIWETLAAAAAALAPVVSVDALLGQLRAAWRTAGTLAAGSATAAATPGRVAALRRRPPVRDAIITLRANLTLQSTACRHAVRLAATLAVATGIYRVFALPRGYWLPLTAVLVLKPEFHDTFARGIARISGTILGAALATLIAHLLPPGPRLLTAVVLVFVWAGYALLRTSYAVFTVCITGYVVFLLMLAGVPEMTAVTYRIVYTAEGGLLALAFYAVWPTWTGGEVRPALAALLEAHAGYVQALLEGYGEPARVDLRALGEIRGEARLTRSNAEAVIERMLVEPPARHAVPAAVAMGLLAATRRHALAALALHAGLEQGVDEPVAGIARLTTQMTASLRALAAALRTGAPVPALPPLRQTQLALAAGSGVLRDETDLMVDSVNTMAALLATVAARPPAL